VGDSDRSDKEDSLFSSNTSAPVARSSGIAIVNKLCFKVFWTGICIGVC